MSESRTEFVTSIVQALIQAKVLYPEQANAAMDGLLHRDLKLVPDVQEIRAKAEGFALGYILSDMPNGLSFEAILAQLQTQPVDQIPGLIVWEPFEHHDGMAVSELLTNLADDVERLILA